MSSFYGQMVIGAPGSGKSTYCSALQQIFQSIKRPYAIINLDPANETMLYEPHVDVRELVTVDEVMHQFGLGPNGALRYCMQTLGANMRWLMERLEKFQGFYLIIDMPGQLELYCADDTIRRIVDQFTAWRWHICAVHFSDSTYVNDPGKFVAVILSSLTAMVNLEVAQVNVLSKVDLRQSDAPFRLDYLEELPELKHLVDLLDDHPSFSRYKKLNKGLCQVIQDYGLVSYLPLNVQDKEMMGRLITAADNANGFSLVAVEDFGEVVLGGTQTT